MSYHHLVFILTIATIIVFVLGLVMIFNKDWWGVAISSFIFIVLVMMTTTAYNVIK